jgi:hypothetical protein
MSSQRCEGCGKKVRIGGGIGDFWTLERGSTGGMELELADGSEWFLCFECIDRLPDDREVTAEDVAAIVEDVEANVDHEDASAEGEEPTTDRDGDESETA